MSDESLKKWLSQLRKGALELCVLGLIAQGDSYAFALIQALQANDGLVVTEGALYPLLKRLQKEGLVESYWLESENGPPRKYYRLSSHGQMMLQEMSQEWTSFSAYIDRLLKGTPHDEHPGQSFTGSPDQQIPLEVGKATQSSPQK